MKSVKLFDYQITDEPIEVLLELFAEWIPKREPHQVVTLNPEKIMLARRNKAFSLSLKSADLLVDDSAGLQWAAKQSGQVIKHRVTGVDLTEALLKRAAELNWKVALVGGLGQVAAQAASVWQKRYRNLAIIYAAEGLPKECYPELDRGIYNKTETELAKSLHKLKPDILLVAMPDPKQELFISRHKDELGIPVMIAVGGTFDFAVGKQKRAPLAWQRAGLEWLWRLLREPRRLGRQWRLLQFIWLVLLKRINQK